MQQHSIVIGGGMAGLATACYLARGGRSVTLLEKSHALGGRAATDHPHGYALNRGAHALYSGGAASEVLRELGVSYAYGIPKRLWALDARGLHRFPASLSSMLTTSLLDGTDKVELARFFVRPPDPHAGESARGWIERALRRPRNRQLLTGLARVQTYSSALDAVAADVFVARLEQTMTSAVHYVSGGWQTLVDGVHEAARRAGVTVRTGTAAERVEIVDGRASGVRLASGEHLGAAEVILATTPDDALRLLGADTAPTLARTVGDLVPGYVAALDVALRALPVPKHAVVFDLEQPRFLTVQSTVADLAPAGGAVVHLFTQPDYRQHVEPAAERATLERLLDHVQPGWRELVVVQRFLPRMLGTSALPLVSLRSRAAHRSHDVPNVYLAGDWVGTRGYLVDTCLDSARETARQVLAGGTTASEALPRAA